MVPRKASVFGAPPKFHISQCLVQIHTPSKVTIFVSSKINLADTQIRINAHLMPGVRDGVEFPHTAAIILAIKSTNAVHKPTEDRCAMIGSGTAILLSHIDPAVCPRIICLNPTGGIAYVPPSDGQ